MNCSKVIIESDAEPIIRSFGISKNSAFDIVVLVQDCLVPSFFACQFSFAKRDYNRAMHDSARKALSNGFSAL